MKKMLGIAVAAAAALFSCGCTATRPAAAMRAGTYNIRLPASADRAHGDGWEERKADLVQALRNLELDVGGLQEVTPAQMAYLREQLPEFGFVGEHRGADRKSDEASPVFYRKDRFDVLKSGTFWLSETPDVPGVKGWGAACPRVCSYLILKDRATGVKFCFANTHTDHVSALAREKGMMLVVERMRDFGAGAPVVFTGDHNCRENEQPAQTVSKVLKNALYVSETPPKGPWRTFNGWRWRDSEVGADEALRLDIDTRNAAKNPPGAKNRGADASFYTKCGGPRIDYIYVSDGVRVLDYETSAAPRPGKKHYPSDHFPVAATIVIPRR